MTLSPDLAGDTSPGDASFDAAAAPVQGGPGAPAAETPPPALDRALAELGDSAQGFARTSPREKAALLRSLLPGLIETARAQVEASCAAKGIDAASATAGEEWLAGPVPTLLNVRLLADALDDIAARGRPRLDRKAVRVRDDGRVEVDITPRRGGDAMLTARLRARALMPPGATRGAVAEAQARFYQQAHPEGRVALVLSAGNVASAPPMDALYQLFVEGRVVLLKMSPVNAYLGPILERALGPLVARGLLRIVHGGADTGAYLAAHPVVTDVHITGSAAVHDLVVWGAPGREQARRRAAGEKRLDKPITSALGNVSPVIVMPFLYGEDELWFQARSIATQVVNNASFNCTAAKVLVLPRGFAQRPLLLRMLQRALGGVRPRRAYHPGAEARYAALTAGRAALDAAQIERSPDAPLPRGIVRIGEPAPDALPWTLVCLEEGDAGDPLFSTEPFCGLLSIVEVGSSDPVEFIAAATRFCNERLWGTLCASIVVHPLCEEDPVIGAALDRALLDLRYGAITVNQWPACLYGMAAPPWGGHPSATPADVQSGVGFVHNTSMLGGVEKTILRAPLTALSRPAWFCDHRAARLVGERLAAHAAAPSWGTALGVAAAAVRA